MSDLSTATSVTTTEPLLEDIGSVREFENTPLLEQFPFTDSYHLIMHSAASFGEDTALEFLLQGKADEATATVSFAELGRNVTRTANLLNQLGIEVDDAVSIILPISLQTHYAIWGAQAAGIANPINPMLEPEHIAEIIAAANAKVVICLGASPHSDIWEKVTYAVDSLSHVTTLVAVHIDHFTSKQDTQFDHPSIEVLDFNEAISTQNSDSLDSQRTFLAEHKAAYFHTGGTTGRPKLAQLSHGNMAFIGQLMQVYTSHMERHTILCGLPLFHIYGVIIQGISAFSVGNRIILMTPSGFRNEAAMHNFWKHIERFQVRGFSTVPTVLMALSHMPVGDSDISCLNNINSGAAPLSHPFELSFEKKFDVAVGNGYGMTETTALISRAPQQQPPGSVGMRIPYSQIRIVELEDNKIIADCDLGDSGVILVKGPQVFIGYRSEQDNQRAWLEDGWFNTGDIGYMDDDGFLYLSGRAKDLIIRSGHNIDPELIEVPLSQHPDVSTVIAIGYPDLFAGELPMAFVVLAPGKTSSQQALLDYCSVHISERAAVPKRIEFLDAVPLTAVGKIFKPKLRQMMCEQVIQAQLKQHQINGLVTSVLEKKRGLVVTIKLEDKTHSAKISDIVQGYNFPIDIS